MKSGIQEHRKHKATLRGGSSQMQTPQHAALDKTRQQKEKVPMANPERDRLPLHYFDLPNDGLTWLNCRPMSRRSRPRKFERTSSRRRLSRASGAASKRPSQSVFAPIQSPKCKLDSDTENKSSPLNLKKALAPTFGSPSQEQSFRASGSEVPGETLSNLIKRPTMLIDSSSSDKSSLYADLEAKEGAPDYLIEGLSPPFTLCGKLCEPEGSEANEGVSFSQMRGLSSLLDLPQSTGSKLKQAASSDLMMGSSLFSGSSSCKQSPSTAKLGTKEGAQSNLIKGNSLLSGSLSCEQSSLGEVGMTESELDCLDVLGTGLRADCKGKNVESRSEKDELFLILLEKIIEMFEKKLTVSNMQENDRTGAKSKGRENKEVRNKGKENKEVKHERGGHNEVKQGGEEGTELNHEGGGIKDIKQGNGESKGEKHEGGGNKDIKHWDGQSKEENHESEGDRDIKQGAGESNEVTHNGGGNKKAKDGVEESKEVKQEGRESEGAKHEIGVCRGVSKEIKHGIGGSEEVKQGFGVSKEVKEGAGESKEVRRSGGEGKGIKHAIGESKEVKQRGGNSKEVKHEKGVCRGIKQENKGHKDAKLEVRGSKEVKHGVGSSKEVKHDDGVSKEVKQCGAASKEVKHDGGRNKEVKHGDRESKEVNQGNRGNGVKHESGVCSGARHDSRGCNDVKHGGEGSKSEKHEGEGSKEIKHGVAGSKELRHHDASNIELKHQDAGRTEVKHFYVRACRKQTEDMRKNDKKPMPALPKDQKKPTLKKLGKELSSKLDDKKKVNTADENPMIIEIDDDELVAKTWNFRPRKPIQMPNPKANAGSSSKEGVVFAQEKKDKQPKGSGERHQGISDREKKGKGKETQKKNKKVQENKEPSAMPKFSLALTREEIEEDLFAMTGGRPSRRPKKRAQKVQKQIDQVFPGMWLSSITLDSYKVPENTAKGV